jgi:hypothetical protein
MCYSWGRLVVSIQGTSLFCIPRLVYFLLNAIRIASMIGVEERYLNTLSLPAVYLVPFAPTNARSETLLWFEKVPA